MSTAILPDDSVVVRMPTHTVHVDASQRAIHVREPSSQSQLGGIIRASFPLTAADRIRLMRARTGKQHLCLDLTSGETLDLGEVPSTDVAMVTARAISDVTRCKIEVAQGVVAQLPGASERFSEGDTYDGGARKVEPSGLSISPENAERMFEVCEALMESADGLEAPSVPPVAPSVVPGDLRTVDMTWEEAEQVLARSKQAAPAPDGAEPVAPSDLEEDESDRPTVTPSRPTAAAEGADGLSSTDRDRPLDEIGVDGLAQTVADRPISDLDALRRLRSSPDPDGASESAAATQPDRPLPPELYPEESKSGLTQPDMPSEPNVFDESTESGLEDEPSVKPIFADLLLESQVLAAQNVDVGATLDQTDLQKAAAPRAQSIAEAVVELLRVTVEALPEASISLADDD